MEAQELQTALSARNPRGSKIPWAYMKRQIAKRWCVPPDYVQFVAPWWEVEDELRIMAIESAAEAYKATRPKF